MQLKWLEIKLRSLLGKEKTWRKVFSLFLYLRFFQYDIEVNSCCLFLLISQAFLITMPFSLIWIPHVKIWRTVKIIYNHAIIQLTQMALSVALEWKENTTAINFEFIRRAWHKTSTTKGNISRSVHFTQKYIASFFYREKFRRHSMM